MKKIRKKVSFLTKIMLVFGLLFSNLSSLSVVFADEVTLDVSVVEDKLNVKYLDELAEEVEKVKVNVYENYTYLDETNDLVFNEYDLTAEEVDMLVSSDLEETLVLDTILSTIIFDGIYSVKVEVVDVTDVTNPDGVVIDTNEISMEVLHDSGLDVSVVDTTTGIEINKLEDGKYPVSYDSSKVSVVAKVLAGGLKPTDMFMYEDEEYMAEELIELPFGEEFDFAGYLYGDYTLPVEVKLLNSLLEEVVYSDSLDLLYGDYYRNAELINSVAATDELALNESYIFDSETKNGKVYILLNEEKTNTMLDLYKMVNTTYGDSEIVSYTLSNSEYEDVLAMYDEVTATVSLEEYLESIILDETAMVSLVNDGLTVVYKVIVVGDMNNDNALTEDDLKELINQIVGESELNIDKADLYANSSEEVGNVDVLDVMYLNQVIENNVWDVELFEDEALVDARLELMAEDIVSGDEFTVNYVLTLSEYALNGVSGIFNYDHSMLELVSVDVDSEWLGNSKDGKFIYLTDNTLTGTETLGENEEIIYMPEEYVVVSATFRALMAGMSEIKIENPEYFYQDTYLVVEEAEISTEVVVNASDNNDLLFLVVDGKNILEENVLDYEITVSHDVTSIDVDAIPEIEGVTAISIITPEELVEGANTITITVVSESGNEKVYTVTVIREKAPEEEKTTQMNYNNYYNDYEEEVQEPVTPEITDEPEEEVETKKEEKDSNLSRIIIIILILFVIAGLIYLIFKDEDDKETKKANKEIDKLKKETKEPVKKVNNSNNNNNNKNKNKKNKKK